jgi:hypothetical protein
MGDLACKALKETFPNYKLALPLDADEFLVAYRDGSPVPHKLLILMQLEHMWQLGCPCFGFRQYCTTPAIRLKENTPWRPCATLRAIRTPRNTYTVLLFIVVNTSFIYLKYAKQSVDSF